MGRRPIGKQAMSGAERQRRYIEHGNERLVAQLKQTEADLDRAKARIAEVERLMSAKVTPVSMQHSTQEKGWHKPSAEERRILKLEAKIRELEALVLPLEDPQTDALRQYKRKVDREYKVRWRQFESLMQKRTITISSKDYALFLAGFHPDASKEKRDQARNRFEQLYKNKVIRDHDKVEWPPKFD